MYLLIDKCKEYFDAVMIDPLLEVTPTMALAETFTAFFVQPFEHIGRHIGKFFAALLQETSWMSSPLILMFVFVALLLILVMIFNYKFRLPFFLVSFEPRVGLNSSYMEERAEQKSMITELKKEVAYLQHSLREEKVSHRIYLTSLPNASSRIEALQVGHSEQATQQDEDKQSEGNSEVLDAQISSDDVLDSGDNQKSLETKPNSAHFDSSNENPLESSSSQEYEDSLTEKRVFEPSNGETGDGLIVDVPLDTSQGENSDEQNSTNDTSNVVDSYQITPKKKLVANMSLGNPNETDFEWVTELVSNKFEEIKQARVEENKTEQEDDNHEVSYTINKSDFLDRAKGVFKDVLE